MSATDPEREQLGRLLEELIELRTAVAEALGREQYLYCVLDEAIESGHGPRLHRALAEFEQQPDDLKSEIRQRTSEGR